jgi:hypothetical protein
MIRYTILSVAALGALAAAAAAQAPPPPVQPARSASWPSPPAVPLQRSSVATVQVKSLVSPTIAAAPSLTALEKRRRLQANGPAGALNFGNGLGGDVADNPDGGAGSCGPPPPKEDPYKDPGCREPKPDPKPSPSPDPDPKKRTSGVTPLQAPSVLAATVVAGKAGGQVGAAAPAQSRANVGR